MEGGECGAGTPVVVSVPWKALSETLFEACKRASSDTWTLQRYGLTHSGRHVAVFSRPAPIAPRDEPAEGVHPPAPAFSAVVSPSRPCLAAAASALRNASCMVAPTPAPPPPPVRAPALPLPKPRLWSAVALEPGGRCFVGVEGGEVRRGVVEHATSRWKPRVEMLLEVRGAVVEEGKQAAPPDTGKGLLPCNWSKESEVIALEAVTMAADTTPCAATAWPWSCVEASPEAAFVVDSDSVHAHTHDSHVVLLHSLATLCTVTDGDGERLWPLAALVPLVPHWLVARTAFHAQCMSKAYSEYARREPPPSSFAESVASSGSPLVVPPVRPPPQVDVATFTPSAMPFQRRPGADVVQYVPGWGRFIHMVSTGHTRAVFQDRTLVLLKPGGKVDMLLHDGTPVATTTDFSGQEPHLAPYITATCDFHTWATADVGATSVVMSHGDGLMSEVHSLQQASAGSLALMEASNAVYT